MTTEPQPQKRPFDPVVIDLTDPQDYILLINALEEVEAEMKGRAEDEQQRIAYNKLPEDQSEADYWIARADRARKIIDDIERQLEANSKVRHEDAGGAGDDSR